MTLRRALTALAPALLLAACSDARRETTQSWVVLSNGEAVGVLEATTRGERVSLHYEVDNNGRGPTIDEAIELGENGYPIDWVISGESLFGAAVDETYGWSGGEACWRSQADEGCVDRDDPPLYIENDGSPWALGLYARALLAAPDRRLSVLPAGTLEIDELGHMTLGDDELPITLYALKGLNLSPQILALDADGRLFSVGSGGSSITIRSGYEIHREAIGERVREIEIAARDARHARLRHRYASPVRIEDVHVFDPASGQRSGPTSVVVVDGVIASVGSNPDDDDAVIVDGAGGTLLPGLFDMHAHTSYDSMLFHLAAGVTSTRDMGNDPEQLARIMAGLDERRLAGPRITPAGLIEARTPYSVRIGIVAEDLDEALDAVRRYADDGYYEIKIYNSMIPEWVTPLITEAGRHGLGVTGHIPAFTSPNDMIRGGYDSIAHVNQLMLGWLLEPGEDTRTPLRLTGMRRAHDLDLAAPEVQETVRLMREHGTALDTTAIILERLMLSRAGDVQPGDRPYLDHMPIGYQRYRKRTFVPLDTPEASAEYEKAFERVLDTIGLLHDNGVDLLIGTDDGTGFSVHRELELYVEAGISPSDTLGIASLGATRYLGQAERIGRIAAGMQADFFLVPGDPTTAIRDVRQVQLVSVGGTFYLPEEIYAELGVEPFGTAPAIEIREGESR